MRLFRLKHKGEGAALSFNLLLHKALAKGFDNNLSDGFSLHNSFSKGLCPFESPPAGTASPLDTPERLCGAGDSATCDNDSFGQLFIPR